MDSPTTSRNIFATGLWHENPALVRLLGLCPLLAVTSKVIAGIGLGIATMLVMMTSLICVSLLRRFLTVEIRVVAFALLVAAFTTVVDLFMNAFFHDLHRELGLFVPLIATNCMVLARAEEFAKQHSIAKSALDAFATSLGFVLALTALAAVRELVGHGTLMADAYMLFGQEMAGMTWHLTAGDGFQLALLPAGAFFGLAILIAAKNVIDASRSPSEVITADAAEAKA